MVARLREREEEVTDPGPYAAGWPHERRRCRGVAGADPTQPAYVGCVTPSV